MVTLHKAVQGFIRGSYTPAPALGAKPMAALWQLQWVTRKCWLYLS